MKDEVFINSEGLIATTARVIPTPPQLMSTLYWYMGGIDALTWTNGGGRQEVPNQSHLFRSLWGIETTGCQEFEFGLVHLAGTDDDSGGQLVWSGSD